MTPRGRSYCAICQAGMRAGVTVSQILSKSRKQPLARIRQSLMHSFWRQGRSQSDIARLFKRDHTTVSYAVRQVQKLSPIPLVELPKNAAIRIGCVPEETAR